METGLAGRRLQGRYVLENRIDVGGMAEVWRGLDEVLGRPVAVKVLRPSLAEDPGFLERFRVEAVAAARLSHPSVVRVYDTGVDDGLCYIVMELAEGRNLADVLAERRRLEPGEAVEIARAILEALAHAHAAGVVHRDVKPANIVLAPEGAVKVTDFGIAKAAFAGDLTTTGRLLGTARYLAPEQVADHPADARADLYAVGLVLYEMLTGRPAFDAETDLATATMRLTREPVPPRALTPGVPRALEKAVMRSLARDPAERYQSADEMRAALDRLDLTAPAPAPPPAVPVGAPAPAGSFFRSWLMVPLLLALLAAAAIAAGLYLRVLEVGGPLGIRPAEEPEAPAGPWRIAGADDVDPEGDGAEHPTEVALAIDGDPATAWTTERYNTADLGGVKDGVGMVFDLGRPREVGEVRLVTPLPGWRFELRGSADGASFARLEGPDGSTSFVARAETAVTVEPGEVRYVLVWITELADAGDGYRAAVAEVEVLPPG